MRLLELDDNGGFNLVEYVGRTIPRYAILSHTWGADHEEVTFKDMSKSRGADKSGRSKLAFCAKQAAQDDLRCFWVDTCCIDKSSSTELSEAINSMFQWYQGADKCYVYLADVSIDDSVQKDVSFQQNWKVAFRRSRWFTRGWTLQELLAPKIVEFFSKDGKFLGNKVSLRHEICEITGISIQILQGSPLSQLSVHERILWAEQRETKREEDAAYSLLGIFSVHMPLIYGEGRDKAFMRLLREIEDLGKHTECQPSLQRFCITVLSRKPEHLDLFLCGPDGHIYTLWWIDGKGWSRTNTDIGGDFPPGAKITVVSRDTEKLDLFACDIHGRIYTCWWHVPEFITSWIQWTTWSRKHMVGQQFFGGTDVVALLRKGQALDLFARKENGQINRLKWTKQEGWTKDTQGHPLPYSIVETMNGSNITVAARTELGIDLFLCDKDGNIKTLGWENSTGWTDWKVIGQKFSPQTEITAITSSGNTFMIFACHSDGQIRTMTWRANSGWANIWETIPFGTNLTAGAKIAAVKLVSETTHLFVRGSDGLMYTCWCHGPHAGWTAWQQIKGEKFSGSVDVAAVVRMGARAIDLFVSSYESRRLRVCWTRGSGSNWEDWRPLELPGIFAPR